jgi:putative transposase
MPFEIVAYVILPDHLHFIWTLPEGSGDYSTRWRMVKSYFTRYYKRKGSAGISASRKKKMEQDVWQRRFWEHLIRDPIDLARHVEYIHYNPIKHGYVSSLMEWEFPVFNSIYVMDCTLKLGWKTPIWSHAIHGLNLKCWFLQRALNPTY